MSVEPGVFLGKPFFVNKGTYIGLSLGSDGHIIVVGGTGRGKTTCVVMPTMKTWTSPMIVTDIKGELSAHYDALYQEWLVDRPYLVFDPMSDEGPGYDPFWWVNKDDPNNPVNNMREITYAMIPDGANVNDKYWYDCERGVLLAALKEIDKKIAAKEREVKAAARAKSDSVRKTNNKRCYAIGELAVRFFPELMKLEPGKNMKETAKNFQPLEALMSALAANREPVDRIAEQVHYNELLAEVNAYKEECPFIHSGDSAEEISKNHKKEDGNG